MPPDGKLDASGSPRISSLPENSATALPSPVGDEKRVVLLGGDAGQRLEPVRVVRRAVLDRPLLHRRRDRVGDRDIERLAVRHRAAQRVIDRLGQPRLLHFVVEHEAAERFGRARPRGSFASVTDQSRIALIASPSTAEPMTSPPFSAIARRIISRACRSVHYAQYPCRSGNIAATARCKQPIHTHVHRSSNLCRICTKCRSQSDGPVQPSSARNSASTMAVAPQISTPCDVKCRDTVNATPSRCALASTTQSGADRADRRRRFENARDLAVGGRQARGRVVG